VADNVTVTSGSASYTAATDDCATGQVPLVKLAYGADGNRTHVTADADGLLVNLGANNDVTVSGTVGTVGAGSTTATLANVAGSASSVTLQALNADRLGLIIVNDSAATLYVKFGAGASTTSYTVKLGPDETYSLPTDGWRYTGIVTGIWDSATGSARITELTA
jgi:hypothetical protein